MTALSVFKRCVEAIQGGSLIDRVSKTDKEYHFQYWFMARLAETELNFEMGGRNSYPDFRMVATTEGYELKGLAYPGRDASFDSNSQVPSGFHNGRTIYYVFGRYPKEPDGDTYPVLDLVICHGDFLNADHDYKHANKSVKAFGSYGDILIRDRKMYVVPTPFRLVEGVAHQQTLILPAGEKAGREFVKVGVLARCEAAELIVGYSFDLQTNVLLPKKVPNPGAGREHLFHAWRLKGAASPPVSMRAAQPPLTDRDAIEAARMPNVRLIETDAFPFEFLSRLAERESWRKEIHRPIYHVHKWWAKRLGSVFRGILLGTMLPETADLAAEFYKVHRFADDTVFDPFMGSGTTVGEAHKLGFGAIGRDINPVAVRSVRTAFGPMDRSGLKSAFEELSRGVGEAIRALYRSKDSKGRPCDVLYHFWVMQVPCPGCRMPVDLFPSWVIARNAYPDRKPEVQVLCPSCGDIFPGVHGRDVAACRSCGAEFDPGHGPAKGARAACRHCGTSFAIIDAVAATGARPGFRLYGKLVLTRGGAKEYLPATADDHDAYRVCSVRLRDETERGEIVLPTLALEGGFNTRQALGYNFRTWRDFFNDRQLLALGWLRRGIEGIADGPSRAALRTLFSGVLEFNNLFASYKGEGTGAVRHMFSHHILKPERTPIEANVWGTPKSSGSFSNLFRGRLLRAIDYRLAPTEVGPGTSGKSRVCALPFTGEVEDCLPTGGRFAERAIYLSCGDSADIGLPDGSIGLVVTDPPFFDNVHYSELADFFHAWQQHEPGSAAPPGSTRRPAEVQDPDAGRFAAKLGGVFHECRRILKDDGLLVFTYHHSRDEGWKALAEAVLGAGFAVVNSQPVKAEMSVATPKSQAKEPIQLDIIVVCRKAGVLEGSRPTVAQALESARAKLGLLRAAGFELSRNDRKIVVLGQLLTTLHTPDELDSIAHHAEGPLEEAGSPQPAIASQGQLRLFD